MEDLAIESTARLAKRGGAEKVSVDAAELLVQAGLEFIEKITVKAMVYAKHASRVTVKTIDLQNVLNDIGRECPKGNKIYDLSIAGGFRLAKNYKAKRVSEGAKKGYILMVEDYIMDISRYAAEIAAKRNRKTIIGDDIKSALKKIEI